MGVALKPLLNPREIKLSDLNNKTIAIDAFNTIHQFLSIIRQRDGTPLKDAEGNITSHLSGLLHRTANLVELGMKPVYVFDGKPHPLKLKTIESRQVLREQARKEWIAALDAGDTDEALKKAKRTSRINDKILTESKLLLDQLGIPYINAPGEGEAQAAYLAINGDADAAASQDFDSLLFGTPILIRNITITGKRKMPGKKVWVNISPEEINLKTVLSSNDITLENLVDIGILVGTDFNDGIKGIGPKKAIKLIKKYVTIEEALKHEKLETIENCDEIRNIFLHPNVTKEYEFTWNKVDEDGITNFLCDKHQFSVTRVNNALEKFEKLTKSFNQKNLFDF